MDLVKHPTLLINSEKGFFISKHTYMYYTADSQIFVDGKWVKPAEATVSLFSQTMHYGMSIFEGIRSYANPDGHTIFKAKEHYERLHEGCELLYMKVPYTVEELIAINEELLERNGLTNAYVRPLVYSGEHMSLNPALPSAL